MGTITQRKNKKGDTKYSAQIRLRRNGAIVYQEAQTFDRKQMAQAWLKRRETELAEPGAIERANRKGVTIKEVIEQYQVLYGVLKPYQLSVMGRADTCCLSVFSLSCSFCRSLWGAADVNVSSYVTEVPAMLAAGSVPDAKPGSSR